MRHLKKKNGGSIRYQNGGTVKRDSTRGGEGIDLFGMEAVLEAKRKRDAEMEGLSEVDKLRKSLGIPEGGADLDLFGIEAVLDAREAAGLSRNPLDALISKINAYTIEKKRQEILKFLVDLFSDEENTMMMRKDIRPRQ